MAFGEDGQLALDDSVLDRDLARIDSPLRIESPWGDLEPLRVQLRTRIQAVCSSDLGSYRYTPQRYVAVAMAGIVMWAPG